MSTCSAHPTTAVHVMPSPLPAKTICIPTPRCLSFLPSFTLSSHRSFAPILASFLPSYPPFPSHPSSLCSFPTSLFPHPSFLPSQPSFLPSPSSFYPSLLSFLPLSLFLASFLPSPILHSFPSFPLIRPPFLFPCPILPSLTPFIPPHPSFPLNLLSSIYPSYHPSFRPSNRHLFRLLPLLFKPFAPTPPPCSPAVTKPPCSADVELSSLLPARRLGPAPAGARRRPNYTPHPRRAAATTSTRQTGDSTRGKIIKKSHGGVVGL